MVVYLSEKLPILYFKCVILLHGKHASKKKMEGCWRNPKTPRFSDYLADFETNNAVVVQSVGFHF